METVVESGLPCLVGAGDLICWAYADGGVFRNSTEPIVTTADNPAFDLVVAVRVAEDGARAALACLLDLETGKRGYISMALISNVVAVT